VRFLVILLRIEEMPWAVISHPHIFFSTQNDLKKKVHINTMMICTCGKKIKVFGVFLSIRISTFPFQRMYKMLPN